MKKLSIISLLIIGLGSGCLKESKSSYPGEDDPSDEDNSPEEETAGWVSGEYDVEVNFIVDICGYEDFMENFSDGEPPTVIIDNVEGQTADITVSWVYDGWQQQQYTFEDCVIENDSFDCSYEDREVPEYEDYGYQTRIWGYAPGGDLSFAEQRIIWINNVSGQQGCKTEMRLDTVHADTGH